ncbi:MAG: beta-N-acetylhexosaminidase [Betaproteobacteria bacterium]
MRKVRLPPGPVVVDVPGTALTEDDLKRIRHPAAGAVILFARNYETPDQLTLLCEELKKQREPELPICVDHEGGRVQRFREGFTLIPPMRTLGKLWDRDRQLGKDAATAIGYVIASELGAHGVDFSFAPCLDLDYGGSSVIGDRALHYDPTAVGALGACLVRGLGQGGVAAVGKHFPGHGYATADSHVAAPTDDRPFAQIFRKDVLPYKAVIEAGLAGVMPAHVVYTQVDHEPAGYSKHWLQEVLRGQLKFEGVVFSDDLSMEGAAVAGGPPERARAATAAGCDMVLLCNNPQGLDELLESLKDVPLQRPERVEKMLRQGGRDLRKSVAYRESQETLRKLA